MQKIKVNKLKNYTDKTKISNLRSKIQILSFILFVYGGYIAIDLGRRLPIFSCPYVPGSPGGCYLMGLQHEFNTTLPQLWGQRGLDILKNLGLFLAFFLVLNKAWCGFLCPLGTLQDWITKFRKRIGIGYTRYDDMSFKALSKIKYILLFLLLAIPMAIRTGLLPTGMRSPFCQICPVRVLMPLFNGDTSQLDVNFSSTSAMILTSLGLIIAAIFIIGSFLKKRFFCFFCPMSALHYIFSKFSFLRLEKDGSKCTRCGNCYRACDVGIVEIADDITSKNIVKDDCIMCFKCVEVCPEDGALDVKFLNIPLYTASHEGFFKRYGVGGEYDRPIDLEQYTKPKPENKDE